MEGWSVTDGGNSNGKGGIKQEPNDEAKTEIVMGQLLDVAEDNLKTPETHVEEKEAPKKGLLQQLYELQGLEVDAVTTTTTTATITSIKTKLVSAITSSEESMKEPKQNSQAIPMTPLSEGHDQTEEPVAVPTNESIIKISNSPSKHSLQWAPRSLPEPPKPTLRLRLHLPNTVAKQVKDKADISGGSQHEEITSDPFGGLWGYAASKKVWAVPKKEEMQEEQKRKERQQAQIKLEKVKEEELRNVKGEERGREREDLEKKYTRFADDLDTFWTKNDEKKEKEKGKGKTSDNNK
ncbi:MAG: hypothetical protein Q9192_003479 [Flavoplaca navasiana]